MRIQTLLVMSFAAGAMQTALAHTELAETVPADRAMIAAAPENLRLKFSEPVRLTALTVQRDGATKRSLGPLPADTAEAFAIALPTTLENGHYVVTWRALSEDTHVMSGEFMFAVGAEGSHDAHMNHGPAAAGEHHDDHGGAH